jgi:hypothetical protein
VPALLLTLLALHHRHPHPPPPAPTPPSFTGNGTGISEQGGTPVTSYYVRGGWWNGNCNQRVFTTRGTGPSDSTGTVVGVYIDDSINTAWPDHSTEDNCVRQDAAAGWKLIIAASPLSSPQWDFAPEGATYTAFEWYPYCGSTAFLPSTVPTEKAYIVQWNFVFNEQDIGLGSGTCPPTPRKQADSLRSQIQKKKPTMVLYY